MSTHTTSTTWTEVQDQLTPTQAARLRAADDMGVMPAAVLLEAAIGYIDGNNLQREFAGIPAPADAIKVFLWFDPIDATGRILRYFNISSESVGGCEVLAYGTQYTDGSCERYIRVQSSTDGSSDEMTAAEARQVAASILVAADKVAGE